MNYVIRLGNQCDQRYVRTGSNLAALKIGNLDSTLQFPNKEQAREWAQKHLIGHKYMELAVDVAKRQAIEVEIAKALVLQAIRMGYELGLDLSNDGGELEVVKTKTANRILQAMFDTDDERLLLFKDGKFYGWVYFVYGNDGWDVINDYTVNTEEVLSDANVLIDKYCKEWENASS